MVFRTFEAEEIVRLPRMTTTDTIALATALVTRAEAMPSLPPSIARELGRVRRSLEALLGGAETRVQEQGQGIPRRRRTAPPTRPGPGCAGGARGVGPAVPRAHEPRPRAGLLDSISVTLLSRGHRPRSRCAVRTVNRTPLQPAHARER
jgi:hypothetical protein